MANVYLASLLAHLDEMLSRPGVTDIWINRPCEIWTESLGGAIERFDRPALTTEVLERLARQIAAHASQGISRQHPILSASLPDGTRVQIVAPPATREHIAFAFRKHGSSQRTLADYMSDGSFRRTNTRLTTPSSPQAREHDIALSVDEMLRDAVRSRKNILISGGTATGKTTFLNALIAEVPTEERLILIEDTLELQVSHPNVVGLIAARSAIGEAQVTTNDLLAASLRMRPDRILLGELRGTEAFTFLRAINTGHPGSMTTIHADTPARAVEQLTLLVLQSGMGLKRSDIYDYVVSTIDLFVQLDRGANGRQVSSIVSKQAL